jgi:outer membrane protein, heavy metal efflux system
MTARAQWIQMNSPRRRLHGMPGAALLAVMLMTAGPAGAAAPPDSGLPGATVETVLEAGRRLSPQLRASVLETQAMAARADAAGALPDPTFTVTDDEVDRTSGPRINKTYFMLGQTFPLWGKRDLQRSEALEAVDAARGRERATADTLDEQIKIAFARYYTVTRAIAINRDVAELVREMTRAARSRYAQGAGDQAGVILAQTEETRTAMEGLRLKAELTTAIARLNALLARPADAPLAKPLRLRPLPVSGLTVTTLMDRARKGNPRLFAAAADIRGAQSAAALADKAWYPDVTVSAGPIQRDDGPTGFSAILSLSIPLQQGPKEAGVREAAAKVAGARQSLEATRAEIEGDLGETLAGLEAARQIGELLRTRLLPQYQAAYRSRLAGYRQGRGDLEGVLAAEHRLHDTNIELLRSDTDAQTALATIERLTGGAL